MINKMTSNHLLENFHLPCSAMCGNLRADHPLHGGNISTNGSSVSRRNQDMHKQIKCETHAKTFAASPRFCYLVFYKVSFSLIKAPQSYRHLGNREPEPVLGENFGGGVLELETGKQETDVGLGPYLMFLRGLSTPSRRFSEPRKGMRKGR